MGGRECPRRTKPDATALIKEDPPQVGDLFDKFEKTGEEECKQAPARDTCTSNIGNKVDEGYVEHDGAKVLISQIMSNIPASWRPRLLAYPWRRWVSG